MYFALPESRRLSDKEPPWKHRMLRWLRQFGCKRFFGGSRYSSARTTEASAAKWPLTHKEKHYEIDPNSELRQICCVHVAGGWTQCERASVVRRFAVRDGRGGSFHTSSIPPDTTELYIY